MSTPLLSFDTAHRAVLSMDLQTAIVSIYAKGDFGLITRAANVLKEAREHRLTPIPVRVGFRPGLAEISLRNPLLSAIKNSVPPAIIPGNCRCDSSRRGTTTGGYCHNQAPDQRLCRDRPR